MLQRVKVSDTTWENAVSNGRDIHTDTRLLFCTLYYLCDLIADVTAQREVSVKEFKDCNTGQRLSEGDKDKLTSEISCWTSVSFSHHYRLQLSDSRMIKTSYFHDLMASRTQRNLAATDKKLCLVSEKRISVNVNPGFLISLLTVERMCSVKPEVSEWVICVGQDLWAPPSVGVWRCRSFQPFSPRLNHGQSRAESDPTHRDPGPAHLSCTWPADADRCRTSEQQRSGSGNSGTLPVFCYSSVMRLS